MRTAHCFADEGIAGLYDKRSGNGTPKADDAFRRRVGKLLLRTPEHFGWCRPTWTREILCLQMEKEGWPAVAVCTMAPQVTRVSSSAFVMAAPTIMAVPC